MLQHTWKSITMLATGVLLTLSVGVAPAERADGLTRELLVGLYPSLASISFEPRPCVAGEEMFDDVPAGNLFCPWIEELARRGITEGCTATRYCPADPVTRAQMAAFLVRATEACPTLDPADEMIRVGGVCFDKYEASIWDAPVGGQQILGDEPEDYCHPNGQDCDDIYARSVAGVEPATRITWFQAQAALANSGKRLPTSAEWQMAARGTPDPGDTPGPEDCNTMSSGPAATGERANCGSSSGLRDMVGNVWEWVADWDESAAGCQNWPAAFGSDRACIGRMEGDPIFHFPGAFIRGGSWSYGATAGPFAVGAGFAPHSSSAAFGFRGAR